jgi:hypothetical protein
LVNMPSPGLPPTLFAFNWNTRLGVPVSRRTSQMLRHANASDVHPASSQSLPLYH